MDSLFMKLWRLDVGVADFSDPFFELLLVVNPRMKPVLDPMGL